ncbi:MAG: zinc ribbon domain-containing protein, partial [bacterium]
IEGGAGFLFKGKGFYITDYRSKEYKQKVEKEKKDSAGSSDLKKSDQKPKGMEKNTTESSVKSKK